MIKLAMLQESNWNSYQPVMISQAQFDVFNLQLLAHISNTVELGLWKQIEANHLEDVGSNPAACLTFSSTSILSFPHFFFLIMLSVINQVSQGGASLLIMLKLKEWNYNWSAWGEAIAKIILF